MRVLNKSKLSKYNLNENSGSPMSEQFFYIPPCEEVRKMTEDKTIENMTKQYLPFEDDVAAIDQQIEDLKQQDRSHSLQGQNAQQIRALQVRQTDLLKQIYSNLTPWQTVQVARHPQRPILGDYLNLMFKDIHEMHGDRCFGDDPAIVTALGQVGHHKVMIIGQNKGKDIKEKVKFTVLKKLYDDCCLD